MLACLDAATGPTTTRTSQALREHEHRTAIDQFRVTLGRAAESHVFVDVACDDDARGLSAELLEDAAPYDADDLIEHFADDAPPEERVQARTNEVRALRTDTVRYLPQRRQVALVVTLAIATAKLRHPVSFRTDNCHASFWVFPASAAVSRSQAPGDSLPPNCFDSLDGGLARGYTSGGSSAARTRIVPSGSGR